MARFWICALAAFVATGALAEETGRSGGWTWRAEFSADGGGYATALSPAPGANFNDPAYLVARCLGGRSEFMVGTSGGWGVTGQHLDVTTQVDDKPPATTKWDVSTNGMAVFLDSGVEDFMRSLPDDGKLRFAVKTRAGETFEGIFPTSGFGVVREKIARACGWNP